MSKGKEKRIKVRNLSPNFNTHVRKMPTLIEKKRKLESKHKDPLIKY